MTSKNTVQISKFNKVAGYKFSLQKSVVFQYIHNKLAVREIKEAILFTTASKRIKNLKINLTTEAKDLHNENYKTLMNKTEENKK